MAFTTPRITENQTVRIERSQEPILLKKWPQYPTTPLERALLIITIVLIPLEDHIPAIAGRSIIFLLFGVLGLYVFFNRPKVLSKICRHPLFLIGYIFLVLSFLIESLHPYADYQELIRVGQMLGGAIFVASLCRDRWALRTCMYGYLLVGLWMSVLLFLTAYGALQGVTATNFQEATVIRAKVFHDNPLQANLNRMAFFTAQGAVVALVLTLTAHSSFQRNLFFGITALCLIATFLPLSRSGIAIVIISCTVITFIYGLTYGGKYFNRFVKTVLLVISLGTVILMWVPDAVFSRLTFSTHIQEGEKMEARARIYTAALEHLPEYITTGVGTGNYWGPWGRQSKFAGKDGVYGAHNGFIQVTIYWGFLSLLALCGMIYQAYRCLPKRYSTDTLSLYLVGINLSLFLYLMVTHVLAFKGFSLGLGMLVGAHRWIWPQGTTHRISRFRKRIFPQRKYSV